MADPFDTATIRRQVLAGWLGAPARFREDANAEEDLVRGGYRDRLLVELAQNAADAALRGGQPGRLRLQLDGTESGAAVLRAANTGVPLDAAGVRALASLRASAKREETAGVGRFGVGFAAVLAVSDEPAVRSTSGGVRFSAADTRAAVAGVPGLAAELTRREGHVPVLRLPWPVEGVPVGEGAPPQGFPTEVVLPLRAGAVAVVRAALRALQPELLLALPGLGEVDVVLDGTTRRIRRSPAAAGTRLTDGDQTTTWALAQHTGELPTEVLADRPVEERARRGYTVTWAVPLDDDGLPRPLTGRQVVHAPTASDEPLSLPLRLIAPFPLGPDRRHVAPGAVTDALVAAAADTLLELLTELPADAALLALVPRVGLAAAELDAALGAAVLDRLGRAAWLPVAGQAGTRQRPDRAAVLDEATEERVAVLAGVLPGLLPADWSRRSDAPALRTLGVRRVGLAEVVEAVRGVTRPPSWWAQLYAALDGADRAELGALPVPLADGRTAHGPAGVLLPDPGLPVARLAPLGLRLAEPEAAATGPARRLLERLGARPATASVVLADAAVRAAVEGSLAATEDGGRDGGRDGGWDGGGWHPHADPGELAEAVLALVAAADPAPGALPWLADLALPDAAGGWAPAGELVLPGSSLADVLQPGALGILDAAVADRADPRALRAVGVLDGFALLSVDDPDELDVHAVEEWVDAVLDRLPVPSAGPAPPPRWPPLVAVRDLELIADWPRALPLLAALPSAARADVVLDGVPVPGYLRWWLRTHRVLHGARPDRLRHPDSTQLQGLYEPADAEGAVLELLGPPWTVADVLADVDGGIDLLHRLGDPARSVPPGVLRTVYARLAQALDGVDVDPPDQVRVTPDRVVTDAVVLDAPWLQPLNDRPVVPAGGAPGPVADLLDVPLVSELVHARVTSRPARILAWAAVPGAGLAADRLGLAELTGEVAVHAPLTVGDVTVAWWPSTELDGAARDGAARDGAARDGAARGGAELAGAGLDHVDGSPAALGRALAWRMAAWPQRQALAEAFAQPERAAELAAEDAVGR